MPARKLSGRAVVIGMPNSGRPWYQAEFDRIMHHVQKGDFLLFINVLHISKGDENSKRIIATFNGMKTGFA
jgi:hypothetical protein